LTDLYGSQLLQNEFSNRDKIRGKGISLSSRSLPTHDSWADWLTTAIAEISWNQVGGMGGKRSAQGN